MCVGVGRGVVVQSCQVGGNGDGHALVDGCAETHVAWIEQDLGEPVETGRVERARGPSGAAIIDHEHLKILPDLPLQRGHTFGQPGVRRQGWNDYGDQTLRQA